MPQVGSSDHDVFINFRGEDIRKTFVGHLYSALKGRRIRAFIDSKDLWKGEDIEKLLDVISGCKLSIAVFSQRYAESEWCLRELSQMLECHKTKGHTILPIFFKVKPSDVKNQTGCFEISPLTHAEELPETLLRWKDALRAAGDKNGWVHQDEDDESELVAKVVEDVSTRLDQVYLMDAKYPVGLESRAQRILDLLSAHENSNSSEEVQFLGICGQGGIGKTTIAATVYNCISESFDEKCFLGNVRGEASNPNGNGLLSLQNNIICKITGVEQKACSVEEGSQEIKKLFQSKKTLLVLDDVDDQKQLNALARDLNWFGHKSRIIITTRDSRVLSVIPDENINIYEHEELNQEESLKLFSLHAFSKDTPPDNFMQLSVDIVRTTGGLPLALEVLGSDVRNRDQQFWESRLQGLQRSPVDVVFESLKKSFDSLQNAEKLVFLDVACLFIGWQEETVISVWEACGFDPRWQLQVLKEKSLLKIDRSATKVLRMHDQIRDMGRRIACNQELDNPHKHSRLWSYENIMKVLKSGEGNEMVEGLRLDLEENKRINLHTKKFEMMPKLRLLNIDGVTLEGSFHRLPSKLRWLQWHRCPLKQLSANSFHDDLVMLDLSYGSVRQAWKNWRENKWFQQLKVLRLSYSMSLSQSPDFSGFPHLERLYLDHCACMVTLHKSVGELQQLVYLNLEHCSSLKELPNSICSMKSLGKLTLNQCKSLKTLPGSIGELKESLVELSLDGTNIEALPDGVALLKKLKVLRLSYNRALMNLPRLENLTSLCEFSVGRVYENFLDISVLYTLVESLGNTKNMKKLEVLSLGAFCVRTENFRGTVNTINSELWKVISEMIRGSTVLTNQRSWQRQGEEGTSLGSSIENWTQIWIPLQMTVEGSLRRYLIPDDIAEIGACKLVVHVSLNTRLREDLEFVQISGKDISLTFDSYVPSSKGNKIACKSGLVIEGSNKLIGSGQVEYIHEFRGFDWFGVQLEGIDSIEISAVSANFMLYLEVLQVNLFLIKDGPMIDSHQLRTECQSYGDQRCFGIVRDAPMEDEDQYQKLQQSNLLRRKKSRGLMKWMRCMLQGDDDDDER